MERNKPLDSKFDISIQIQLPNEWDQSLAHFNVGVTAGVETDKCPIEWATVHREKMNMLIVPSSHTKMGFLNSATGKEKTPVLVVPESYFHELENKVTDQPFQFSTKKNFLTIGMFTAEDPSADRKNLANTIRWFCQEYDGNKDMGLVVKTSKGRETSIDRELVRKTLDHVVKSSGCKNPPKVYMLHGPMERNDMNALYKHPSMLGLISATRGEGFGLPMLEAAVAGLPVVCTNWSSVTEFLKGKSFLGVDYDVISLPESRIDNHIFMKGFKWADPRESNFKRKLRKLEENTEEYKNAAKDLSETLKKTHCQVSINARYDEVLNGIITK
jgi:glycosyltransferase involved in cell wall biosynthesis